MLFGGKINKISPNEIYYAQHAAEAGLAKT